MSFYNRSPTASVQSNGRDNSENSETFLSRVFGFNSIYSNLHDNPHFYDLDSYESPTAGPVESTHHESGSIVDNRLLESDSDLSSDSDHPPSPLLAANTQRSVPPQDEESFIGSLAEPPAHESRKLKFSIPASPRKFFRLNRGTNDNLAPAGGEQTLFRKQRATKPPEPSFHTQFQRENRRNRLFVPPKERALYLWANIVNMDEFLIDIYYYYRGKGFCNIIAGRVVDIIILVFILTFTTFLTWGIDYDHFFNHWSSNSDINLTLYDLVIPNFFFSRVPFSVKVLLLGFTAYIALRCVQLYFDFRYRLAELSNFYHHLLEIHDDQELMTISWSTIVERVMALKDYNTLTSSRSHLPPHFINDLSSKVRLNAHDIANRIMRKENYMIALINKDILDLSLRVPPIAKNVFSGKAVLTRTLEWNLKICINNFVFNENGQVNPAILKESSRNQLAHELSSRFKMAALINLALCPFIVVYFVLLYFFRYFNEYKSNPSSLLALRQYTPWAEWKLREFNELPHFFVKRLHLSVGPANTYINQFPGGYLAVNAMAVANFFSGAILAVLVIMGLFFDDEEHNFWSFELSQNRSTLFYISVFGTIWAVTSNSMNTSTLTNSLENLNSHGVSFYYDPEASLRYVSQFTHYLPTAWNGRLHTAEVKNRFCELYSLKIIIIINEILSLILTPFVLWFKVSHNSSAIVDFFRDYSIHVDGLGHVCYFAMFNFEEKDKNMLVASRKKPPANPIPQQDPHDDDDDHDYDYYTQDDKMFRSYMYFLESYGGKKPAPPKSSSHVTRNSGIVEPSRVPPSTRSLGDSSYTFGSIPEEPHEPQRRKGVLGMINQFSKHDQKH